MNWINVFKIGDLVFSNILDDMHFLVVEKEYYYDKDDKMDTFKYKVYCPYTKTHIEHKEYYLVHLVRDLGYTHQKVKPNECVI